MCDSVHTSSTETRHIFVCGPAKRSATLEVPSDFRPLKLIFKPKSTKMWEESVEGLLQKYCDEAQVREALHRRSYYRFKKLTTCFNLPILVLSALSGSFQFLSKGYPDVEQYIVTGTASMSILTAVISAVSSYLNLGEQTSKHEQAANAWLLFHNEVKHQLSLRRELRADPAEFLTTCKTNYDRLFELSPICSSSMIRTIRKKVEKHATEEFVVPSYLNGFRHSEVFRENGDD